MVKAYVSAAAGIRNRITARAIYSRCKSEVGTEVGHGVFSGHKEIDGDGGQSV